MELGRKGVYRIHEEVDPVASEHLACLFRLKVFGINKGFQVVFSEELPDRESIVPCEDRNKKSQVGTISYIPAVFGCVCAQAAIRSLMERVND